MTLVTPSALSEEETGKALSTGWAVNFAVGCTHGCLFCYAQRIVEKLNPWRLPRDALRGWGSYLYVKPNLEEEIMKTPWRRWSGEVVLMSATHDPYLPELYFPKKWPRRILEAALPHGVRFNVLTRSTLALQDLDLFVKYKQQIRLMSSTPTLDDAFARAAEPRAPPPTARLAMLKKAKEAGARIGVVVAPIIPREGWRRDLDRLFKAIAELEPEVVFGEMLHPRGSNLAAMRERGIPFWAPTRELDKAIGAYFELLLAEHSLNGKYWYEWEGRGRKAP
ncbi:DNA repair photolyase [Pyrobaculum oguniense TE7]|uniref:DNA repair photolyase n=1 Tax=Pyrobaculum oguniense (strain DSM 13380 / JCM 10595 / TE7) TaxID=698757 RepID=H6QCU8_PYROT|nr:DNA repair photolyase [Pyrobaculum oguniense TE7]